MTHTVRLKINGVYMHPHSGIRGGKPVDDLLIAGIRLHLRRWREVYKIDYRFVPSRTSGFPVIAAPVISGGQHYRGMAGRTRITLHNAWVPAERRWSDNFWARDEKAFVDQVGIILHHELGHYWFRFSSGSHSTDRNDLMHPWVGRLLTQSLGQMQAKFGTLRKTKAMESAALAELTGEPAIKWSRSAGGCKGGRCYAVEV